MPQPLVLLFTLTCVFFDSTESLSVQIVVEPRKFERQSTVMQCIIDLQGSPFLYVAWQKDGQTFFQFSRRRNPPKEVFPVAGVNLDADSSNMTHVFLNMLSLESSGRYSCGVQTSGGGQQAGSIANMTIVERDPTPLLIASRKGIFIVDTKNYSAATTWVDAPPVLSVGYHMSRKKIYYGASGGNIINQNYIPEGDSHFGGALILSEEGLVTSIAVDWLHNTLYFTDDYLDSVGMVNLTTEGRFTLLEGSDGVNNPESIVVDPFQGYLFWGDNDESDKKIVASGLDAKTNRQTIVNTNLKRAILALDLERRRLYFIGNEGLSSCKYDGSDRKGHYQHKMLDSNVNSLSYYDNYIFWTRYETGKSTSGLFFTPFTEREPPVRELPIKSILDVKVLHPDLQKPSLKYSCELIGCSHGCDVNTSGSAFCTCPEGFTLSTEGTTCSKGLQSSNCEQSMTTVNSKHVCKGELVFEDSFDTDSLDLNKWQHTVQISSDHEVDFVIFDKDPENTFLKDGNLVVKPTLVPNDVVVGGNISLVGCSTPIPHLCHKQAFSFDIIPPVKSGLINTGHSFNFRYGTVTIRAKVPKGDWLYPVLNLHATKDFYYPNYRSGVIRIASIKGNKQLTCNGIDSGNKVMSAGVMLGPQNNVKSHFVNKAAEKEWSEDFHTFKFTWAPDELSFSVDDNSKEDILPKGKTLREVLGFSVEESLDEWKRGTRLTPLDQNFYLSIGVSAGGGLEFSDDCTSGNNQDSSAEVKPWRNFEVKSLLKFWQKESEWYQTWREQPALLIDYVNVRAL